MRPDEVEAMAAEIAALLGDRLHLRGATLADKLARGRRLLPRRVRREAACLAAAAEAARHPRLRLRLDAGRIARAHAVCRGYLQPLGQTARRRRIAASILTGVALAVFAAGLIVVGYIAWQGTG